MSLTIDNAFVTKFQDRFHVVAQQRKSRLEQFAKKRLTAVVGESFTIDLLGQSNATPNRPRHSDLQYANLDNTRRIALMQDLEPAELIDAMDKMKMLIDPTNQYTEALLADCNRFKDTTIINAALGNVITQTANNTTGSSALPAAQTIAAAATGLTVAKLRAAKILLDEAEMDDSDYFANMGQHEGKQDPYGNLNSPSYVIVCTSQQIDNLLGDSDVQSIDSNSVKALVAGAVNTFMGFLFVRVPSAFLPKSGTSRSVLAYAPRAIEYGIGKEPSGLVERIPQKNAWQVMTSISVGAGRAEDAGVVEILCTEV